MSLYVPKLMKLLSIDVFHDFPYEDEYLKRNILYFQTMLQTEKKIEPNYSSDEEADSSSANDNDVLDSGKRKWYDKQNQKTKSHEIVQPEHSKTRLFSENNGWPYATKRPQTIWKTSNASNSTVTEHSNVEAIDFDKNNSTVLNRTSESQTIGYSLMNSEMNRTVSVNSLHSSTISRSNLQSLDGRMSRKQTSSTGRKSRRLRKKEKGMCSRRHLEIDTIDFGWNEWIFLPSRFEIGFCEGSCELQRRQVECLFSLKCNCRVLF